MVKLEASYPLLALRCEATYYEDATKPCKAQETERCKELAHLNAAVRPADTALMLRLVAILLPCSGHYMLVCYYTLDCFFTSKHAAFPLRQLIPAISRINRLLYSGLRGAGTFYSSPAALIPKPRTRNLSPRHVLQSGLNIETEEGGSRRDLLPSPSAHSAICQHCDERPKVRCRWQRLRGHARAVRSRFILGSADIACLE